MTGDQSQAPTACVSCGSTTNVPTKLRKNLCRPCNVLRVNLSRRRRVKVNRTKVVAYLLQNPCVDCGETDWLVLQFDHRDPTTKTAPVSRLVYLNSWPKIKEEIDKCDVRCANCHSRRTAEQMDFYSYLDTGSLRN